MTDYVLDSGTQAALYVAAQQMGFWSAGTPGSLITQGPVPGDPNPQASFFLNEKGVELDASGNALPGYWSRIRINGLDPFTSGVLTIPAGITIYPPVKYLADGVTVDTTYAQPPYAVIA